MMPTSIQTEEKAWQAASTVEPRFATAVVSDSAVTAIADARDKLIRANRNNTDVINGIVAEVRAVHTRIIDTHTDDDVVVATARAARAARAVTIATLKSALANPVFTAVGGLIGGAAGAAAGVAAGVGIAGALGGVLGGALGGSAIDAVGGNTDTEAAASATTRAMTASSIAGSILVGGALGATLVDSVGGGGVFSALGGVLGGAVGNGVGRAGVGCVRSMLACTNSSLTAGTAIGGAVIGSAIGGAIGAIGSTISGTINAVASSTLCGAIGGAVGGTIGSACIARHGVAARTNVSANNAVDTASTGAGIVTNAAANRQGHVHIIGNKNNSTPARNTARAAADNAARAAIAAIAYTIDATGAHAGTVTSAATHASTTLLGHSAANNRAVIADVFARAVSSLTDDTATTAAAEAVANIAALDEITNLQGHIHITGNKNDSTAARNAARIARVAARAARAATGLTAADLIARKIRDDSVAIDSNV